MNPVDLPMAGGARSGVGVYSAVPRGKGTAQMSLTSSARHATSQSVARLACLWVSLEIVACSSGANEISGRSPGPSGTANPKVPSIADASRPWTKTLDTGADDEIAAMLAAPPSGVYVLGTRSAVAGKSGVLTTLSFEHPVVFSIDASGNTLWSLEINTSLQYRATGIARGADGMLAVTATTLDSQFRRGGLVAFVNDAGSLVSSFNFPTTQEIDPSAVKIAPDGDVVVAGRRQSKPWVSKLSNSGAAAWSSSGSSTYSGYFADVALSTDGSISILSVDTTKVTDAMPMYAMRLDSTGQQVLWSQPVGTGYGGVLTLDQDGNLYVAAQGDTGPSSGNVIVKYSADGTELRRWAATDQEFPQGIAVLPNGVYVLAGNFGAKKLSQFDPTTAKLLGSLTVSDGALAFAMIDASNAAAGSYQVDDIGLEWLTIPAQ